LPISNGQIKGQIKTQRPQNKAIKEKRPEINRQDQVRKAPNQAYRTLKS